MPTIQLKRSTTPGAVPAVGDLIAGEVALNVADSRLYHKNSANVIIELGMSPAERTKLGGIATGANNYVHPTGDGNQHVPATGTTNNRKFLMAGATAGSSSWQQPQWTDIGGTPTTIAGYGITNAYTKTEVDGFLGLRQATADKGQPNGYAGLDASGTVPISQLPDAVLGGLQYRGTWNASTNTPTIPAASTANKGWYYVVNVAGSTNIDGINVWRVGDWIVSDGTAWSKIDNAQVVTSVAGKVGAVVLVATDISDTTATGRSLMTTASAAAARTTLGLGGAATLNVGTTAGTVAAGNDARFDTVDGGSF